MTLHSLFTFARSLLLPHSLVVGLAYVLLTRGIVSAAAVAALPPVIYLLAGMAAALGARFHRSRVVLAACLVAATYTGLVQLPPGPLAQGVELWAGVLPPLLLVLIALLPERRLLTGHGLGRLALLLAPAAAAAWLTCHDPQQARLLLQVEWFAALPERLAASSHLTLAANTACLAILGLRFVRRRGSIDIAFFWVLIALAVATAGPPAAAERSVWFTAACLCLVIGLIESFHFLAFRDDLTGLPGRRALNEACRNLGRRYVLAMVDVDHFKKVNDRHGHDVGDQVLRMVAARLSAAARDAKVYRYGGEEFTLVLPGKTLEDALPRLEELRAAVADAPFRVRGQLRRRSKRHAAGKGSPRKKSLRITVSVGAAAADAHGYPHEVLKQADKALYRAKKQGRNRVCK